MSPPTAPGIAAAMLAILASVGPADAMSAYRWSKRPLVVFAPDAGNAALASQRGIVAGSRGGLIERAMVIVYVVGDRVTSELGGGPGMSAQALRARYGVSRGAFRAILVGKDGGAKLSSSAPLAAGTLFRTIDAMPMRAQEMRRR